MADNSFPLQISLNQLGIPVGQDDIERFSDGQDHSDDFKYRMIQHVIGFPPKYMPRDVLDRYGEVSGQEHYIPFLPHTPKLYERLTEPLKAAKRCYCLGEYLATLEICSHIGEMLCSLLWEITPLQINGLVIDAGRETMLFGRTFEKQGQDQRVKLLKAVEAITDDDAKRFDWLRTTRRGYFHIWSQDTKRISTDAREAFFKVIEIVKNVLQVKYDGDAVSIHPNLLAYVKKLDPSQ